MPEDNEETDNIIRERIAEIFPSPQVANTIIDLAVHNRPQGWSRGSNAPYYKELFAKQIQKDIDKMIENGSIVFYRYSTWCGEHEEIMTHNTLYNRINQSKRYLIEMMDTPERKYGRWNETVRVRRNYKNMGVAIEYIPGFALATFEGEEAQPTSQLAPWKQKLEIWLEDDKDYNPFCVDGLLLSPEEVAQLKSEFAQLATVKASITPSSVKAIKIKV